MEVRLYNTYIPSDKLQKVDKLISESGIDEKVNYSHSKYFITAEDNDNINGLVCYGEIDTGERGKFPRFLHIILDKQHRKTRFGTNLLKESEKILHNLGFNQILCYISNNLPNRDMKKKYALKWGYRKYNETNTGEFFYRNIVN